MHREKTPLSNASNKEELCGTIERITYQNGENGYTVAQLKGEHGDDCITLVGTLPALQAGETVFCQGFFKVHPSHGRQFHVLDYNVTAPATLLGIEKYLGSGLIRGIGRGFAKRIVDTFKEETLDIIEHSPEKLIRVARLGKKRIESIKTCWSEQKAIRAVMLFLQSHSVSPVHAQKIFKAYGNESIQKVKENPFCLARDIFGIGFKTADQIASKLGVSKTAPTRLQAALEYILSSLSEEGHVCYPVKELIDEAAAKLEVDQGLLEVELQALLKLESVVVREESNHAYLKPLFIAEKGIARELQRLKKRPCLIRDVDHAKALSWVEEKLTIQLAPEQQEAIKEALQEKLQIITGGPGTGKSTITKAILSITEKLTSKILLAAPTGKAAKRMTEITGKKAVTLHALLEFDPRKRAFKKNRESPLSGDLIIVDEASMIDTLLMYNLLKAVPDGARLIFVGDIDQLPSVGPGNVLKEMIQSNALAVNELKQVFRQAMGSQIIVNAHRINQGLFPLIQTSKTSDFFFLEEKEPETILQLIEQLLLYRLPKRYGFDQFRDIQILSPMRRGLLGTENLNTVIQERLHGSETPLYKMGRKFYLNDKVMQLRNNYDKGVFNGDSGTIVKIDEENACLFASFDGQVVQYDFSDLDELSLAYAVSIHKYQGSESPCIIMPIHTSHFKLLHRNLLYTGVTRGKKLVVVVGTKKALFIAVKNEEVKKRHTNLAALIQEKRHEKALALF